MNNSDAHEVRKKQQDKHFLMNFPCFRCKPFANLSIKPVKVKVTKLFLNKTKTAACNAVYYHVKTPRTFISIDIV